MKLPNSENAVVPPEKLRDYILSPVHPVGRFKSAFFRGLGTAPRHTKSSNRILGRYWWPKRNWPKLPTSELYTWYVAFCLVQTDDPA